MSNQPPPPPINPFAPAADISEPVVMTGTIDRPSKFTMDEAINRSVEIVADRVAILLAIGAICFFGNIAVYIVFMVLQLGLPLLMPNEVFAIVINGCRILVRRSLAFCSA